MACFSESTAPTFFLISFSLLVYMTTREIGRYMKNEDVASFSFRKFNSDLFDKYPSFSLCFRSRKAWNKGEMLFTQRNSTILNEVERTKRIKMYWRLFVEGDVNELVKIPERTMEDITMDLKEITFFDVIHRNIFLTLHWLVSLSLLVRNNSCILAFVSV